MTDKVYLVWASRHYSDPHYPLAAFRDRATAEAVAATLSQEICSAEKPETYEELYDRWFHDVDRIYVEELDVGRRFRIQKQDFVFRSDGAKHVASHQVNHEKESMPPAPTSNFAASAR